MRRWPSASAVPETGESGNKLSMEFEPRLIDVASPDNAAGTVLVLHGGASRRDSMMVSPTQLSVLRMIPIAKRIARAGRGRLAVVRLLNSTRGWNATHTPVDDVAWALERLAQRPGGSLPTCLVGHSLGGRAAILSAPQPGVRSVVALAPWVYPTDLPRGLTDQKFLIVHGTNDRVASLSRAAALAEVLARFVPVRFETVEGAGHAMLRHHADFSGPAAGFATETLLG